ncbi:MAG: HD domain-containing protein [Ferruginibacter sp.]
MTIKEIYELAKPVILRKLENSLPPGLYYHCLSHTIDVEAQAERISISENVLNEDDIYLLKIACLYHDSGFLYTYSDHEEMGCKIVKSQLPEIAASTEQLEMIFGLINATKIPQQPLTKLQEIICDADLDYLGRDDFFAISHELYKELKTKNIVSNEHDWNIIQVKFFKQHKYFTKSNKELREQKKQMHLRMIEKML